ncbi:glycosyltransferase family 4 protein [Aquimarina brevivitae]|uniref:Glycosyltransferase involved in cell wall biosynthesis n=1 Tax=Aquimarina brevivitae TaxID=323412 RepID=A0A4Q7PID8_9FLAO|nr:glycosyltransferase family 4 protein [Aquimarina brevivitae]RZT00347.1 glycosyltransferase involved in cell wall biosynthesis [Aquimarina brevivitae]
MAANSDFKERLYFIVAHKWKYIVPIVLSWFVKKDKQKVVNKVVYVAREKDKDWIFGAKVRRLSRYSLLNASTHYHDKLRQLPNADGYFFIYQNYFCRCLRSKPSIVGKKNIVMFTHTNWSKKYSKTHVVWCFNKAADYVICLNSDVKRQLIEAGVKPEILVVMHIATSSDFFYKHERGEGGVGFCSTYSDRKNPDLVFDLITNLPQRHFYLIGRNWENDPRFKEVANNPNFTYFKNEPYDNYPALYSKIDVFVSPSFLEGGPVPILEAMMSNCVPVASTTGFAPDLINHGVNGFLFEPNERYDKIIPLIEKAFEIKTNTRETVLDFTWEECAKKIDRLFNS